jgi:hypothetical protein
MSKKVFVYALVVSTIAIAAVAGISLYRSALAATPTPSAPPTGNGGGMGERGMGPKGGVTDQDLATALGITVDDLTAAYQKANDAALADAVQKGLITQAQADELKTNGGAFPFGGHGGDWLKKQGVDYDTQLAQALGITVDKLQAAYLQAFDASIDREVAAGKLTQDQGDMIKGEHALYADQKFNSALQSAYQAAVTQAVTDGVITQAQADLILQSADKKGFGMDMPFMGFPGFGGGGKMKGGPGWGGQRPAPNSGGQTAPYPAPGMPAATPGSSS